MKKHYSSMHWTWNSTTGERKPKQAFETLDDALLQMRRCRYYGEVQPYVCDVCGKWHIGHYREK